MAGILDLDNCQDSEKRARESVMFTLMGGVHGSSSFLFSRKLDVGVLLKRILDRMRELPNAGIRAGGAWWRTRWRTRLRAILLRGTGEYKSPDTDGSTRNGAR